MVSRREGQVTFAVSALTCWRKVNGFDRLVTPCAALFRSLSKGPLLSAASRNCCRRPPYRDDPALPMRTRKRPHRISCLVPCAHAFRTRKAGFPAPRAACLFALHKTDFRPAQGPKNRVAAAPERCVSAVRQRGLSTCAWQGQQGSNPRPAVLETAALPTELYPLARRHACQRRHALPRFFRGPCKGHPARPGIGSRPARFLLFSPIRGWRRRCRRRRCGRLRGWRSAASPPWRSARSARH